MNLPITSRVKRSPLLGQADNAIDPTDDDQAKGYYESEGKDVTTSTDVLKPGKVIKKSKNRCGIEVPWSDSRCVAYSKMSKDDIKASEIKQGLRSPDEVETITTTTKGESEMADVPIRVAQKGDVMEPWQISRMQRSIKKEQKQIRKSKLKQRPDGVSRRDWKKQVRAEENAAEQKEFQALAERNAKSRASGKRGGSRDVAGFDRIKTIGEDSEKVQVAKAAKAAKLAKLKKENEEKKKSPNEMRSKSPAKKALKGNQNQLPQHLQAAIKAAPGKMNGSPYKMKGSMFKKKY
jgi:type IV secretory pathway VirB10-like protein